MTARSLRRAAERKSAKAARKAAQSQNLQQPINPQPNPRTPADAAPTPNPISEAQLTANRTNAQLSTGATTPEGKAISSRNHTIHGLTAVPCENFKVLPGEDQSAYNQSLAGYRKEWNPTTATEHDLVLRLVIHSWLSKRAIRLQNEIMAVVGELADPTGRADFSLYMRYHAAHMRAYGKALSEIMRLRNFQINQKKNEAILERRELETAIQFESQKQKAELHAARLETIQLKQEAIKQRNQKLITPGEQGNPGRGIAF